MSMTDRHHILFPRQEWTLRPEAKVLRNTPSLIPVIDRELHNEVHRKVPFVPVMGYYALRRVHADFHPQRTTIATLDDLLFSLEQATRNPKSHDIENAQIALAIQAIDIQRLVLLDNGVL